MTPKIKPRLAALLWLHLAAALFAQRRDIRFEHVSVEQGLSNYAVTKIVQDRQGFLWIGTEDGLNKYDGYEFTVYKPDPADSNALASRVVQALYADRAGNLWIGTGYDGLRRYNPNTDKFDLFKHDPKNPQSLAGKAINTIFEDSRGELWIGTNAGLYRYARQRDALTIYRHDSRDTTTISSDYVLALCEDRAGALWIGTAAGLNRFAREKNAFIHYRHNPNNPAGLNNDVIRCLREDRSGVIWIGTSTGLNRYDPARRKAGLYPLGSSIRWEILLKDYSVTPKHFCFYQKGNSCNSSMSTRFTISSRCARARFICGIKTACSILISTAAMR